MAKVQQRCALEDVQNGTLTDSLLGAFITTETVRQTDLRGKPTDQMDNE